MASSSEATSPTPSYSSCAESSSALSIVPLIPVVSEKAHINSSSANESEDLDASNSFVVNDIGAVEMGQRNAKISRPAWRKPPTKAEDGGDRGPIMGEVSWPALSAVRSATKSALPVPEVPVIQGLTSGPQSGNGIVVSQQKQRVNYGQYKNDALVSHENAFDMSCVGPSPGYVQQSTKVSPFSAGGGAVSGQGSYQRVLMGSGHFSNNMVHRQPVPRDYGRRHHGWHSVGRDYAYGRNGRVQLQHQKIGPWNMRLPTAQAFTGATLGLVDFSGFQSPSNDIYYMPVPLRDALYGAAYCGIPLYPVSTLQPTSLEQKLLQQIEYYFSVDNLCKDIYLRTHMDSEGFVLVEVIAGFNRVRNLSQNPAFILDVLRESTIVEVQGEGIRKRDGWEQWLPQPSWQHHTNSGAQKAENTKQYTMESVQEEEMAGKFSRVPYDSQVMEANFIKAGSNIMKIINNDVDADTNIIWRSNLFDPNSRMAEELEKPSMAKCTQFRNEQPST